MYGERRRATCGVCIVADMHVPRGVSVGQTVVCTIRRARVRKRTATKNEKEKEKEKENEDTKTKTKTTRKKPRRDG
jgi:hypothetical protein